MRPHQCVLLAALVPACAVGGGDGDDPRDVLGSPRRATIAPVESKTEVRASIARPDGVHSGGARLQIKEGHVVVHVARGPDDDDRLVLDELRITYQDIVLPPAYFHGGQVLSGVVVQLEHPLEMRVQSTGAGALLATGATDLRLDWDLRVEGEAYGLAPQQLPAFDVELVASSDDTLRVDLSLFRDGVMWTWAEHVVTLGDAEVVTTAYGGID
jgi:hypothetical protein